MNSRYGLYQKWLKKRHALMGVIGIIVAIVPIAAACGEEATPRPAPATPTPQPTPPAGEPTPTEEPPTSTPIPPGVTPPPATSTPPRGLAPRREALIENAVDLGLIVQRLDLGEARDQLMINLIEILAEMAFSQEELSVIHKLIEKLYTPSWNEAY